MATPRPCIRITNACEHNLAGIDVTIPRDQLVVVTGVSGSGKSSLAFDTVFAEGQRKYMESLTAYARQFLQQLHTPDVESIEGLPPTIAIAQRRGGHTPRSTVATTTEIYDYLRLLYARCGQPTCWAPTGRTTCGRPIERSSTERIVDHLLQRESGTRIMLCAPVIRGRKGFHKEVLEDLQGDGFVRARVDGEIIDIRDVLSRGGENPMDLGRYEVHDIDTVVDRVVVRGEKTRTRVSDSVETCLARGDGTLVVLEESGDTWLESTFSERMACPAHPECSLAELEPRTFSFNSPYGACTTCDGLGSIREFDEGLLIPDHTVPLNRGAITIWTNNGRRLNTWYGRQIRRFADHIGRDPSSTAADLTADEFALLMHGAAARGVKGLRFEGVLPNLRRRYKDTQSEHVRDRMHAFMAQHTCTDCSGDRLRPAALHVRITNGADTWSIADLCRLTIEEARLFLESLELSPESHVVAEPILREITARLGFLQSVGLEYLTLDRASGTLSGGEAQRIRLATQVGSGLVGVCYVLDEPTIGLHQRDNARLISTLRHLTDIGNTVLVVEHDEEMIRAADHVIDMGPGAGCHGGTIVAAGDVGDLCDNTQSLTGRFLSGERAIGGSRTGRRTLSPGRALGVRRAAAHNLAEIDVDFPLGGLICVTGVSGSGKSTLVNEVLLKALRRELGLGAQTPGKHRRLTGVRHVDRVVQVNQSPIGRTPRSNPVTYTGIFDDIRTLFAKTQAARIEGWKPGRFSFNVKGGRCEECMGQGVRRIEMHFLPDVFVTCDACGGSRYTAETLRVKWRGKSIADVLDMTIEDAAAFFEAHQSVHRMLACLNDVGLGYLTLGQKAPTLSGGEAQRVKLARELGVRQQGHVLYVLDEPTTGLHFADVDRLMMVLDRLADRGHTLIVIEHNLDVIRCADWIIDLGPEGGRDGGTVVAAGTPEDVAQVEASHTGRCLRDLGVAGVPSVV